MVALVVVLVAGIVFGAYVGDYYHADDAAEAAMVSTENVSVERTAAGDIAFVPDAPQAGLAFYPGGKVQAEAYAPLMQELAERGFLCVIVPMPFNLAVFDPNGADGVQAQFPEVDRWILMGHSLGGVMAASYADGHKGQWTGLVLLGSYSTSDLSGDGLEVLSIIGTNDDVVNRQAVADERANLGELGREVDIPGGNHAQFGSYGPQEGDGVASISAAEQRRIVAHEIAETFLGPDSRG